MSLGSAMLRQVEEATAKIALGLGVVGLINIQFAIVGDQLSVIEANPRASRTVPFVSKAVGLPMAKLATRVVLGERLADMADELVVDADHQHVSVKAAVLPFGRFPAGDALLGPEMKSTGEVMGVAENFPAAFGKAQEAAGAKLPEGGRVFISVAGADKAAATQVAASLHDLGFEILATGGTAAAIRGMGVPVERILKLAEGSPNVLDLIRSGSVDLVINTPTGSGARKDGWAIRRAAVKRGIPVITTMTGASAAQRAILAARREDAPVRSLQQLHGRPAQVVQQRELTLSS
jgi:carbamoyl-phosphate synthase large subunit